MARAALAIIPLLLLIAACAPQANPPPQVAAPPATPATPPTATPMSNEGSLWDVTKISCAQFLNANDDDRAAAAMFYYGYIAARNGIRVIDVSKVDRNLERVIKQCEQTPGVTVPQAYAIAFKRSVN